MPQQFRLSSADTQGRPILVLLDNRDKRDKTLVGFPLDGPYMPTVSPTSADKPAARLIQTFPVGRQLKLLWAAWGEIAFRRHSSTCFIHGTLAAFFPGGDGLGHVR